VSVDETVEGAAAAAELGNGAQGTDSDAAELGQKLRAARKAAGMTLLDLSQTAGVSQSLISQVERGLASPSITTLRRFAAALGVPIASLFVEHGSTSTAERELDGRQIVVREDERKGLSVPRSKVKYELLTPDLNRTIEFLRIEYSPHSRTHPEPMSHPGEENALCLEGSVVVTIEGKEFVLNVGDSISFDSGRVHQVENRTHAPAVLVSAITPPSF
jgi:transcriptional regulator with XRE-family HTH domain